MRRWPPPPDTTHPALAGDVPPSTGYVWRVAVGPLHDDPVPGMWCQDIAELRRNRAVASLDPLVGSWIWPVWAVDASTPSRWKAGAAEWRPRPWDPHQRNATGVWRCPACDRDHPVGREMDHILGEIDAAIPGDREAIHPKLICPVCRMGRLARVTDSTDVR